MVIAASIAVIFAIIKFIELRYVLKEEIILKNIVKDTIIVYVSVVMGLFILSQVSDSIKSSSNLVVDNSGF